MIEKGSRVPEPTIDHSSDRGSRWKDLATLHVPLVAVLALCTFATVHQFGRATTGVDRSWAYVIEWPVIALFAVVVWNRYRRHGSFSAWVSSYAKRHQDTIDEPVDESVDEALDEGEGLRGAATTGLGSGEKEQVLTRDPDEQAWSDYLAELNRRDPPGGPGRQP